MGAEDWIELVLEGKGRIPLARLLEKLVPVPELRSVAGRHGLKPKGFRVERASAKQLAELLADTFSRVEEVRDEVGGLLAAATEGSPESSPAETSTGSRDAALDERLADLTRTVDLARDKADREHASAAKARRSAREATKRRTAAEERAARLESQLREQTRRLEELTRAQDALQTELDTARTAARPSGVGDLEARLSELTVREAEGRRRIAELTSRVRDLEEETAELESYLPRGQRERLRQRRRDHAPAPSPAALVPRFSDEFLRCLQTFELEQERKVYVAVARLVLQGFDYPGLHAKALKGMGGLWSIRAGEHLRVYLTREGDMVTFEGAATREEQPTYLRKKRD